jgi:hypothetical protein
MEVQMNWIEVSDNEVQIVDRLPSEAPPSSSGRKKPPRLPGASLTLPPMPVVTKSSPPPGPQRRNTVEVEMQWVELVDDEPAPASVEATKPKRPAKKPIRREEED